MPRAKTFRLYLHFMMNKSSIRDTPNPRFGGWGGHGIYIHIPFCKQACHYCDFHFSTVMKSKDDFVKSLLKEIFLQKDYFAPSQLERAGVRSIYFGGGSPSVLSSEEIKSVLTEIKKYFSVDADAEITLEANPDDLTKEKLSELKEAGINRLSIGLQSFSDEELKWMNRVHSSEEGIASVKNAQAVGFKNISVDLIYGSPVLSHEQWKKNLSIVGELNVQHLSAYALTVEGKTALAKWVSSKQVPDVDEHKTAEQFDVLMDWAEENQFEQYEISNFAREQNYSRHNSSYWFGEHYLGLGPSAHSFNGTSRQWNIRNNYEYIRSINEGKIPFEKEILTDEQKYNEYVMTSLRTIWGCNIEVMRKQFGEKRAEIFFQNAMKFISEGLMKQQKQNFILAREGKFFADRIASELFA
jgi:oxygen-independent coproporphyrinogen-3 oxidase